MADSDIDRAGIAQFDAELTKRAVGILRPFLKLYFRSEVHGLDNIPPGGSLVVSNHSGGMFAMDVPIFAVDFYEHYSYDRPVYTLTHDMVFNGPVGDLFVRFGFIKASPGNAVAALRSGGLVIVFPGGDYDVYRPTLRENVVDFGGRSGYVRTALEAGVPIVPMVSIGGQETQLFLSRGTWLVERLGPIARAARTRTLPISFGFPFGLSMVIPPNFPLPAKIVTQVLEPIDIVERFGENPDVATVDSHVREVMQQALDRLSRKRRLPILG